MIMKISTLNIDISFYKTQEFCITKVMVGWLMNLYFSYLFSTYRKYYWFCEIYCYTLEQC